MQQFQEFGSVILTVDHTSTNAGPHSIQKAVFSTETLEEAMLALLKYYQNTDLLASASTIAQFQQVAQTALPCMVYRSPENVQIVMALDTFNALIARSSSLLDATTFILDTVGEVIAGTEQVAGGCIPLQVLSWDVHPGDPAPAEPAPAPKAKAPRARKVS